MLRLIKNFFSAAIFTALALSFSGCTSQNPDESTIPWTRPQGWENTAPGFGGGGGGVGGGGY